MPVNLQRMVRFGPGSLAIILFLFLLGVMLTFFGVTRILANIRGGGTMLLLGVVVLLVGTFVTVGIATTKISRVEKKYHNLSSLVGKKGVVKRTIARDGHGVVLVDNELWTATSTELLEEGTMVKIVNIEGVILDVTRDV